MAYRPVSLDHVNIFVRNAEQSHRWYTDILGLHTQDTMYFKDTGRVRAVFLACDPAHAHDVALFEVGEDAPGPQKRQVGLNHFAWRMGCLDDLKEIYLRLKDKGVRVGPVLNHDESDRQVAAAVHPGVYVRSFYFQDPDGITLEFACWIKEFTADDAPAYELSDVQTATRLPNGNTIINNWFNEWSGKVDVSNPPVQAIEVTPDKKVVWAFKDFKTFGNDLAIGLVIGDDDEGKSVQAERE